MNRTTQSDCPARKRGFRRVHHRCDAHVLETEKTWEYIDGAERKYRPQIVGATSGDSKDEYWLVDGTLRLKSGNVGRNTPQASREMRDVSTRLKHMDDLGVTIQVLY